MYNYRVLGSTFCATFLGLLFDFTSYSIHTICFFFYQMMNRYIDKKYIDRDIFFIQMMNRYIDKKYSDRDIFC